LEQSSRLVAHGYLVSFRDRVRFGFADAGGSWVHDTSGLTSGDDGFSWKRLLEVERKGRARLDFRWNTARRLADPFLRTFAGRDEIVECRGRYAQQETKCLMLDERLAADMSKRKTFGKETFVFLSGERISLLALDYDDSVDGRIAVGGDEYAVSRVERSGRDFIAVDFKEGRLEARCVEEDVYRLYQIEGGPMESPISCRMSLLRDGRAVLEEDAAGLVEFIDPKEPK